jgi:hypothetical protein
LPAMQICNRPPPRATLQIHNRARLRCFNHSE